MYIHTVAPNQNTKRRSTCPSSAQSVELTADAYFLRAEQMYIYINPNQSTKRRSKCLSTAQSVALTADAFFLRAGQRMDALQTPPRPKKFPPFKLSCSTTQSIDLTCIPASLSCLPSRCGSRSARGRGVTEPRRAEGVDSAHGGGGGRAQRDRREPAPSRGGGEP